MTERLQSFEDWIESSGQTSPNPTRKPITIQKPLEGTTFLQLLLQNRLYPSEGEAKRACLSGTVTLNGENVLDPHTVLDDVDWWSPVIIVKGKLYTYEFSIHNG